MITKDNKHVHVAFKSGGAPDEGQLAAVNQHTLETLTADQVYVRTAFIAHNGIDRDVEVFADELLNDFARTLPGKGLFIKHPRGWDGDSGPGVGKWFAAQVLEMSVDEARIALRQPGLQFPPSTTRAKVLEASFYIPRTGTDNNKELLTNIDAGVANDVSIGFSASSREPIADATDKVIAERWTAPGEALETSLVWLGAQPGARVHKQANRQTEDDTVDKDAQIKTLTDEKSAMQKTIDELTTKANTVQALGAALGDHKALLESPDDLAKAVSDGLAYRKGLVDDIVALERKAGMVGDSDEDVATAKKDYDGQSTEKLKAWKARLEKTAQPAGGDINGGEPNQDKGGENTRDKDSGSPLANAAVTG